ncbi:MAG: leucyl aminopeptidase [Hyphomicrobiaceae bacterium]
MTDLPEIRFAPLDVAPKGTAIVLVENELALSATGRALDKELKGQLMKAAKISRFTGARKSLVEVIAPSASDLERVLLVGRGEPAATGSSQDWTDLGGALMGQILSRKLNEAVLLADAASGALDAPDVADMALGMLLRAYRFSKYRTKAAKEGGEDGAGGPLPSIVIHTRAPDAVTEQFRRRRAIAEGVAIARDLVNEPANELGPVEYATRIERLADSGLEIEILDETALDALKMGALLGVAQGSARPARVAVMQWLGAENRRAKPVCFIGKGVVFDTGGISMKPAKGMEDMKGDMAGSAAVVGLMHALASRKAPVNAIGIVGLVENMPGSRAQRPGDIVRSMSGQTIEVLNTDAEGRLVLADLLWYAQERFKPKMMVNLATLTGAIMVALGKEHAGLFSNNDRLAGWLRDAGEATAEKLWRMPMGPEYDKQIDSKNADMKNIGGPYGGSITAAQFLARFVGDTPWAHLDIAGTAMASNRSDTNEGWASGFGVRLLDRLVADHYES